MKELIEKLEGVRDYNEYWDNGKQCCIVPISVINEAIQALTSVKSESAEEVEKAIQHEAHEYFKRGQLGLEKAADTERAFYKGAKWMHDFANEEKKQHAIGFAEHLIEKDYNCWEDMYDKEVNIEDIYNEYLTTLNNKTKTSR